ncbi:hypothetical protein KC336_g15011 [Hortaea werneckii]|nr:hypothetical protein KC336_g15011 [Hortaea werneckii]
MLHAIDHMYEAMGYKESRQLVVDQEHLFTKMSWPQTELSISGFMTKTVSGQNPPQQATAGTANTNNDRPRQSDNNNNSNNKKKKDRRPAGTAGGSNIFFTTSSPTRSDTIMGDDLRRDNFPPVMQSRERTGLWVGYSRIPRHVASDTPIMQRPTARPGRPGIQGRPEIPLRTTPNVTAPAAGAHPGAGQSRSPATNSASRRAAIDERLTAEMDQWRADLGL